MQGTSEIVSELYLLAMGRNDQLDLLRDRFRELGHAEPNEDDKILERIYGGPTERTLADYPTRRKELLLAMLDRHADNLDAAADELGGFFDHLRQVGIRGFVAEKANDRGLRASPREAGAAAEGHLTVAWSYCWSYHSGDGCGEAVGVVRRGGLGRSGGRGRVGCGVAVGERRARALPAPAAGTRRGRGV